MCPDCLISHQNQKLDLPIDADVLTLAPLQVVRGFIRVGTFGKVVSHTDDGRAIIEFKGYRGTHTFHSPESWIARCYPERSAADVGYTLQVRTA